MPIDLHDFLATTLPPSPEPSRGGVEVCHSSCLIAGPSGSAKTSVLFQYALRAAQNDRNVLLLCNKHALELKPPLLACKSQKADPAWSRISMKYLESGDELVRFLAGLHLLPSLPDALLVDGLLPTGPSSVNSGSWERLLCRLSASLVEAAAFLASKAGAHAVVACTAAVGGPGDRALQILERAFPLTILLTPDPGEEAHRGLGLQRLHAWDIDRPTHACSTLLGPLQTCRRGAAAGGPHVGQGRASSCCRLAWRADLRPWRAVCHAS
ncbi:hypothetical protein F751_1384 [Auxenochlorella protothecoides]|uniref:Uncharacterized protein n=1 Tax=Auxenochlorella protothecoides TaxID=3075 RepID=A0A087SEG5_AUXPR|nr:hypothetical protein F751_1384 [Auxenochlorella protothecoides]KFM24119.1 hypothetical protein F751_1384 [Auxenochlorella protothecoides]